MNNKHILRSLLPVILLSFVTVHLFSQDFGFGFADEETGNSGGTNNSFSIAVGGEVSASMLGYFYDFSKGPDYTALGNIFSGKLTFSAHTSFAEGVIDFNVLPAEMPDNSLSPLSVNEAYIRVFPGKLDITAGLRKLTWGKADSMGPLDVINPLDYSRIFTEMADNTSLIHIKIARPLIHAAFRFGNFSKIEGVFVPWFEPHLIPRTGRWAASQMEMLAMKNYSMELPPIGSISIPITVAEPNTTTLNYAQAGLRFSTTIGSADFSAQYYYGRLPQPSAGLTVKFTEPIDPNIPPMPENIQVDVLYNPYHQVGFDYAQVLFGFNTRAELAVTITGDLKGDDGSVYNPSIAWSLGFDRDIIWNINLNLQVTESIRLLHSNLGSDDPMSAVTGNYDIEGGQPLTATRLTAVVSRKFFRDELELRTAVVWGIEDRDCVIMPAIIWTKDTISAAFSGGFFTGNTDGQIGQ